MTDKFSTTISIHAQPADVWAGLTDPVQMVKWMGEPEMNIEVQTDWQVNSPICIRGFHHIQFENKGLVLECDKEKKLSYSHLSSASRLPDIPESYTILEFVLTPEDGNTQLTLTIENLPTETIRKHLEFYWRTTIFKIKNQVEAESIVSNNKNVAS